MFLRTRQTALAAAVLCGLVAWLVAAARTPVPETPSDPAGPTPSGLHVVAARRAFRPQLALRGTIRSANVQHVPASHVFYSNSIQWLAAEGWPTQGGAPVAVTVCSTLDEQMRTDTWELRLALADTIPGQSRVGLAEATAAEAVHAAEGALREAQLWLTGLTRGPDPREVELAELDLRVARDCAARARTALARLRTLAEHADVPAQNLARAEHEAALADVAIERAECRLAELADGPPDLDVVAARAQVAACEVELERARTAADAAVAAARIEAEEADAHAASLACGCRALDHMKGLMRLAAPRDGIVLWETTGEGRARPGGKIWACNPVVSVVDPDAAAFVATADERQVAALEVGQKASVELVGYPGEGLPGRVARIALVGRDMAATVAASGEGNVPVGLPLYEVSIEMDGLPDRPLVEGMQGRAAVRLGPELKAVVVPGACIGHAGGGPCVLVREHGTWQTRQVRLLDGDADYIAIDGGLSDGERVAILAR